MIDSHCHIQTEQFDEDRDRIVTSAKDAGVEGFIVPAIDAASFDRTLSVVANYPNMWCGLGIHPHSASEWNASVKDRIIDEVQRNSKVVAVGEIGLDYYYDFAPKDVQRKAFREQIELAKALNKPIIIHTRDSIDETLEIVQEHFSEMERTSGFGQFHCFSGTSEQALRAVELGFFVSFTGNITFKNSTLAQTVQATPIESLLIETDSPYLAPSPHRGKRNEPAFVRLVAEKVAALKQLDITEVIRMTSQNTKQLFRLSAVIVVLLFAMLATAGASYAQVGSRPPDSVMTEQRREAEEMIRKQKEELAKEQERRKVDSLRAVQEQQLEQQKELQEQARKDSIRAVERAADDERARERAAMPIVWKVIGVGGGIGIGNLSELDQVNRLTLSPTSVFAWSFLLSSDLSRVVNVQLSYNKFTAGDSLVVDRLYKPSLGAIPIFNDPKRTPTYPYFHPIHEDITNTYISFDVRFTINPHSPIKFYAGLGYDHVTITNTQAYTTVTSNNGVVSESSPSIYESSFSRGGIKVLFGSHYDFELGDQFIVTPFAEISASFMFSGEPQASGFDFLTGSDPITFTHLNVGATVYWGWFKVQR